MVESTEKHRARSKDELREKMKLFQAADAQEKEPYNPLSTDVIISPFAKCGTTWLQQMFHTLRTRGDLDYDDISRVVPWIETAPRLGIDINAPQRAEPRGFKSHQTWDKLPRGAKYIVSLRDPRDVLVSLYKFSEGWFFEPGAISIDEYAEENFLKERGYWKHLVSWWEHKEDDSVLLVTYEAMKDDPEKAVRRVADFCDIALDDGLVALTLENSSLEFMLAHKDKFDDLMMRELSEAALNLPFGSDAAKVREGRVGGYKGILSAELVEELTAIWTNDVAPVTGFESYADLEIAARAALR